MSQKVFGVLMPQVYMKFSSGDLERIKTLQDIFKTMVFYDKENALTDDIYRDYRRKIIENVEKIFNMKFQVTR